MKPLPVQVTHATADPTESLRTGSTPAVRTIFISVETGYENLVGPVAQWLEPAAHNGLVGNSSPSVRTIDKSLHHTLPNVGGDATALNAAVQEMTASSSAPPGVSPEAHLTALQGSGLQRVESVECLQAPHFPGGWEG